MTHLLLVEDDRDLAEGLKEALELEGYRVTHALDGRTGLRKAQAEAWDLLILDAMLPEVSGFDVLKEMRRSRSRVPVLMLTARGEEMDKVRGLKLGADDYVTKPFGLMELMARIEAVLRRAHGGAEHTLVAGDVRVDFRQRRAFRCGRALALTGREMDLLEHLTRRRGEAVSREELVSRLWGTAAGVHVTTRTVDQHVAALRRKLGDGGESPHLIETVYGFGYRLSSRM